MMSKLLRPFLVFLLSFGLMGAIASQAQTTEQENDLFTVTFDVDMSFADDFDPDAYDVYISGEMVGWAEPGSNPDAKMEPVSDGSHTYTVTFQLEAGDYAYKYFLVEEGTETWDNGEWDGPPDREITVTEDVTFFDLFGIQPGEVAIGTFALEFPPDGFELLVEGASDAEVVITWERPVSSVDDDLDFTWHLDARGGDFSNPIVSLPADSDGNANEITLTMGAIDGVLDANNIEVGQILAADWTVTAEVGTELVFADDPFSIDLERGVVESPFNAYTSISDLLQNAELGEEAVLVNEVIVTFVSPGFRNQHYLSDATGAVLVDDNNGVLSGLSRGDGITGFYFQFSEFRGTTQLLPLEDIDPSSSENDLPYWETTLADLEYVDEPRMMRVENVLFQQEGDFVASTNYGIIDPTVTSPVTFRTHLGDSDVIGEPIPQALVNLVGIADERDGSARLFATHYDLFEEVAVDIGPFALESPADGTELLVEGFPDAEVVITWERPTSDVDELLHFTWHLDARSGDFSDPIVSLPADNNGNANEITLTMGDIDGVLDANDLNVGDLLEADWTVTAEVGTELVFAEAPFSIDLERGVVEVPQIDNFVLQSPPDGTSLLVEGDFNDPVVITWVRPTSNVDEDLVFTWHLDARGGDFSEPIVSIPADSDGNANEITLTMGAIDGVLKANGVNIGDVLEADWTVTAEFEDLVQFADEPFAINLERGFIDIEITEPDDPALMQLFPFVFNMDTDVVDWTEPTFFPFAGAALTRIGNPDPSGLNESDFVLKYEKKEGGDPWAGFFYHLENPVQLTDTSVYRMKVWSPRADIQARIKLELVSGGATDELPADVTQAGEWIELVWDLSEQDRNVSWDKVAIFLDLDVDNPPQGGELHTWYLDDFAFEGVGIAPRKYESISELLENAKLGEKSMLVNEVIVTFVAPNFRNQHYLSDETGAVLVDDTGEILSGLERGDGITGFLFEYSEFRDVAQLLPLEAIDPSSSDNDLPYWESTLADLEYVGEPRLIRVEYVDFLDEGIFERVGGSGTNYDIVDPSVSVDNPVTFRTHLSDSDVIGQPIPEDTRHVTGIIAEFQGNPQLYAAHYDLLEEITRYEVVFNVDMSLAANFDPDVYDVYISGEMVGWDQPGSNPDAKMEPASEGSDIYTITLHLEEGDYQYKYFLVEEGTETWEMGEWDGDPNRMITVTDDKVVNDIFGVQPGEVVAQAQIIHNAADPAAASVDIYVNGGLFVGELAFREATPFVDVPANTALDIAIYPAGADAGDTDPVFSLEGVEFAFGGTYTVIANGVLGEGFAANPDGVETDFNLFIVEEPATVAPSGEVSFFIWHGVTDAPAVDVWVADGPTLVEGAAYTGFTDVITVDAAEYTLYLGVEGSAATGEALFKFVANLSDAGGLGAAILASGFLAPEDNENGEEMGLLVALPDGTTLLLDALEPTSSEHLTDIPTEFSLEQNYPNPFNPTTTIRYQVPESANVTLDVFDVTGRRVTTLVNETREAGVYTIEFDATRLASGMYIYRMQAGDFVQTRKLMLIK